MKSERIVITIAVLSATVIIVHPGLIKPSGPLLGDNIVLKEKNADQQRSAIQQEPQRAYLGNLPERAEARVEEPSRRGERQSSGPTYGLGLRWTP